MTTSALVPGSLPCAVDGHPYLCDPDYQRQTVQVIRQQADQSTEPGEQSLTPLGLWRRSQETWHHGAGQTFLDGREGLTAYSTTAADPHRFRSSKGIDPWTKGQLSLLHPTLKSWSTTNTNLYLAIAQGFDTNGGPISILYVADGNQLYWAAIPYGGFNTLALQNGTGWTATNATIAANGEWFRLTATSAAAVSVTSPTGTAGMPVDPGRRYGTEFWSQYISGGAAKTHRVAVTWYTAAGATISTTTPVNASGPDVAAPPVILAQDTPTAPSNAAFASVTLSYTTNWANGEIHEIRSISFGPYDDVSTVGYPDTWTSSIIQAGQPAQPIQALTTDGYNVWAALGTSGIHRTLPAAQTSTADVPAAPGAGQISLVGYANGFLLAAGSTASATGQNVLWSVTDPLGTPALSVIKTHPNTAFAWTGISQGRSCIYAYGNSGGNGEVYKITIDPNTGALSTAASFATYLPDGETIHALQFYAGGIIMGTGRGLRLGTADGAGNIDYGPLVPTSWPVRCIEPQDRYCWFGWTKYDATNSGLGRVDLGFFTDTLTPAWSSDLMTSDTTQGDVLAAVTFAPYGYTANQRPPVRVFTVAGKGLYIEDPGSRVLSGQLLTGTIRFSTSEPKTTHSLDVRHHALPAGGSLAAEMQRDSSGTWESLGSSTTTASYGPAAPLSALDETAEAMEFRYTLGRPTHNGVDYSQSVEMTRWTAKVLPLPSTIDETFTLVLQMKSAVETTAGDGQPYHIDVPTEVAFLKTLEQSRRIVTLQLGSDSFTVYVVSSTFAGEHWNSPLRQFSEGKLQLVCQTIRG